MIFAYPPECFSNCNYGFVHRWIRLSLGQHVLHMWYFKLSGWIVKKLSGEGDKCFVFSTLYFEVWSCLCCKHWCSVLIWLFVTYFSAFVGDSLVPLLIIVKLFLWFVRPMVSFFHWRVFHVKQIVSLTCSWFFFCVLFLLVFLTYSYTFCGIYFHCLLFFYWVCYCVSLHQNASELCIMEKI